MNKVLGIDLGTTNSCMAVIQENTAIVIPNAEGSRITPSVVAFTSNGERLIGQLAKRQAVTNPQQTISSVKRFMGRRFHEAAEEEKSVSYRTAPDGNGDVSILVGNQAYSPAEISAMLLQKLKTDAETYLGEPVTDAVITVPAYFNDSQRQATKLAGKIAGLNVLRIINEPTAAALAYGLDKKKNQRLAVFDLGGGTYDISILELGDEIFEVKATNGDTHLGGDDFDQAIIQWLIEEFKQTQGVDLRQDKMALQRLKEAAEKAKCELSTMLQTEINLPFITADANGPKHLILTIGRAKLEQLTAPLVDRAIEPMRRALADAGCRVEDIEEVVLVGGQTRMPLIQQKVKEFFRWEPHPGVNPDEVVAIGAAIQAGVLKGELKGILLLDVTPLSLGIETLGGVATKLILRNTIIPTKKSQIFSTAADNQTTVSIRVLQGEREMADDNRTLGRFDLTGIPPAPRGTSQIEVFFNIDANGMVQVSAKDLGTRKEQQITITASSGINQKEIDRMVREAQTFAEADQKKKYQVELHNRADSLVYNTGRILLEHGDKVDELLYEQLKKAVEDLRKVLAQADLEVLEQACHKVERMAQKMGEAVYAKAHAEAHITSENV